MRNSPHEFTHLRNLEAQRDIAMVGAPKGMAPEALPQYLLIYGSPKDVPWQIQYVLNANRCVGRLDIADDALARYVEALISGWPSDNASRPDHSLVWAVVDPNDAEDITHLMRHAIADALFREIKSDNQLAAGSKFLDGADSPVTTEQFAETLASHRPGLVVMTSHGKTGPIDNLTEMKRDLGLPVDHAGAALDAEQVLGRWKPSGAIWYSHACCSAGVDGSGFFAKLFAAGSPAEQTLGAISGLGASIAPLPTALLSAEPPIRAFVGHVEPTFNWTLEERFTGQFLTTGIIDGLYKRLYVEKGELPAPVSYAFRDWYSQTSGLRAQYVQAQARFNRGADTDDVLLTTQLAARDIESTVLLGDPTVAIPPL
ncbi:MAG TPA: hypothetical protein VNO75_12150 [Gemmatimonadaceae bacterium]|nr:hypothetical protein [Gemmatimonadaceae bacterium]